MLKKLLYLALIASFSSSFAGQLVDESPQQIDDFQFTDDIESLEAEILAEDSEPALVEELLESEPDTDTSTLQDVVPVEVIPEEAVAAEEVINDVFLVLDNSGSMKKNDPKFLVGSAVREFISLQSENTRVGIVIFDQSVSLPVPLTDATFANRELILNSLNDINYKGLFTDSPAGIERAIYELKTNAREDAQKSIIFMTDGIVDTGDANKDLEKAKWLREDLAPDAADNDIKIFAIAFTEQADFQLIQSIAQNTNGEYYRALKAEKIQSVFKQINDILITPPEPEVAPAPIKQVIIEAPAPVVQPPPAPVIIEVPAQTMGEEERIRSMIIIAAAIILTLTLLGILILLIRRSKELKAGEQQVIQEAYINDLTGKTDKQTHKLGKKPTMFGRVAGQDTEHLDYIVVNESTIGRRHALIEYKDYSFWIIDQGSINGTFVNEEPVKTEVRLKHGDKIRLHRCEFDFIMPEMEDSGMTVISNTVFAAQPGADESEEATQLRGGDNELNDDEIKQAAAADMDFDLTGPTEPDGDLSDLYEPDPDEEDTVIRELPDNDTTDAEPDFVLEEDDDADSEDETIMLDDDISGDGGVDDDVTLRKEDI